MLLEAKELTLPGAQSPRAWNAGTVVMAIASLAASVPIAAAMIGEWSISSALAAHVAITVATAFRLYRMRERGSDATLDCLGLLMLLFAGPVGGFGVVLLGHWLVCTGEPTTVLVSWYARLTGRRAPDPARDISEKIATGRMFQPRAATGESFSRLIAEGSLAKRQALLGLIGLHYHPGYQPVLQQALRSQDPSVRVQAAAVTAKLRAEFKARLEAALAMARSGEMDKHAAALAEIEACLASGILDDAASRAARAAAIAIARRLNDAQAARSTAAGPEVAGGAMETRLHRLLVDAREDTDVVNSLLPRFYQLTAEQRDLCARSLMRLGRHCEVAALLAGMPTALDRPSDPVAKGVLESSRTRAGI